MWLIIALIIIAAWFGINFALTGFWIAYARIHEPHKECLVGALLLFLCGIGIIVCCILLDLEEDRKFSVTEAWSNMTEDGWTLRIRPTKREQVAEALRKA